MLFCSIPSHSVLSVSQTQGNVPSQSRRNDLEQYSFMVTTCSCESVESNIPYQAQWLKEVKTPSTLQPLFDRVCEVSFASKISLKNPKNIINRHTVAI